MLVFVEILWIHPNKYKVSLVDGIIIIIIIKDVELINKIEFN